MSIHAAESRIVVFAASSLTEALGQAANEFSKQENIPVSLNFDASSRLARQIEQGARADIYFSADKEWSGYLQTRKLIAHSEDILGNQLVLITHQSNPLQISHLSQLAVNSLKSVTIAQETVPAGKYAYQALRKLELLKGLKPKIINGDNVRNILAWVARNEADLGIVFKTDASVEKRVRVLLELEPDLHSEVTYSLSLLKNHSSHSKKFFDFLKTSAAKKFFQAAGFRILHGN